MQIGEVWLYQKSATKRRMKLVPVYITGGRYYGSSGGVSNFWDFREINKDGTLGESGHDYNNGPFVEKLDATVTVTIKIKPRKKRSS